MATTYAIPDGRVAMAATLYNGTGAAQNINNTVNGVSFQPDLVWFKSRNITENHQLFDSVRGVQKSLYSNLTTQELTDPGVNTFNTNGFNSSNANGYTYVGWQWKGGGTPVSNTAGSITSSVSANPTAGFSVVTWTGTGSNATIGHGLGVTPAMIILKPRNSADNWPVWHSIFAVNEYVYLNLTNAKASYSLFMNSTLPTSTVISLGTWANVNTASQTMVAYCFAPVAGYSAFGSYTGNGSADGPFVYLGFRPRFIMRKKTSGVARWIVEDSAREPSNVANTALYPNYSTAEEVSTVNWGIDFLSNGFKIRSTDTDSNASGDTYIYMAFAEVPFAFANAR